MLKKIVTCAMILTASTAFGQSLDPTFNGLISYTNCFRRNATLCIDNFCNHFLGPVPGDLAGTLHIDLSHQTYYINSQSMPLEIVEIAKPELNRDLWVKFRYKEKNETLNGMLTLHPNAGGSYSVKAAGLAEFDNKIGFEDFECTLNS